MYAYLFIFALSLLGFIFCFGLRYSRSRSTKDSQSELSCFLGVPVDVLGMVYYGILATSYAVVGVLPQIAIPGFHLGMIALVSIALLFSVYLVLAQAFSFNKWCLTCLLSLAVCVCLFVVISSEIASSGLSSILTDYRRLILALHLMGFALGLGGANLADFLFFKFLKDFQISKFESETLRYLSQVIWLGLAIIVATGFGLYLPAMDVLNSTPKFIAKMIAVGVIIVNGLILNFLITPRLTDIAFHKAEFGKIHLLRKISFASGAISIVSWYSAFILAMLPKNLFQTLSPILFVYLFALIVAIIFSQVFERLLEKNTTLD